MQRGIGDFSSDFWIIWGICIAGEECVQRKQEILCRLYIVFSSALVYKYYIVNLSA